MEFKVLGPVDVRRDGRALQLPGGKPRALLGFLLLHADEPVSAERLAVALWGEDAPARAARTVQVYVSRLRRALGDPELLTTSRAGYRLRVRPGELDLDRFERLVEEGRRALADGRTAEAAGLLRDALGLWRGPPLADLAFEPFAAAETARLQEQRMATVEARLEADLAAGRHAELVAELQRLVVEHPLRERLHGQLVLALYRTGRQADALEAYRRARELLVEQLGIEPGSELRALERAVLAHDPGLMLPVRDTAAAPGRPIAGSSAASRVRVPLPPTATVGRDAELAELEAVVAADGVRLLTLVGAAGVGKTRVAIELARAVAPSFRDGAVFVSLGALDAVAHVAPTMARELVVAPAPGESVEDALARHLARRQLLLVLDNCEHVLEAAPLVSDRD
jgi:DNA-binding SARP family transcriptional activator